MEKTLQGELSLPGDKSISHRALMLLSLCPGESHIKNLSNGQDVQSTRQCMISLGANIKPLSNDEYLVHPCKTLQSPLTALDCGNSGTTIRLLSGLLAGAQVEALLTGDESLKKRPMRRVIEPLRQMGALINDVSGNGCAPLQIHATAHPLLGIDYPSPIASAQVKSALLLAGLMTPRSETVQITEPVLSRDHTERMLQALGVPLETENNTLTLKGRIEDFKTPSDPVLIPGDISSAAFWMVGAAILPGSDVIIHNVGLNPSRTGILEVLRQAGAQVDILNTQESLGEPYGSLRIQGTPLKGDITITEAMVPALIDEIPIITILGLFAEGAFTLKGAEELRFKESDRLAAMLTILERLGVQAESWADGYQFMGSPHFKPPQLATPFETHHDHRLVMALEILNLKTSTPFDIEGRQWAAVSYPSFFETLAQLLQ